MQGCIDVVALQNSNNMEHLNLNNAPLLVFENMKIVPFMPDPTEGYKMDENFPNCCEWHRQEFNIVQDWFNKFPDCCDACKRIFEKENLVKSNFEGLPLKILKSLDYTVHHIKKHIEKPEWFRDTTNYIDYIFWSFGTPDIGRTRYSQILIVYLKGTDFKITEAKRQKLIEYIEDYDNPNKEINDFGIDKIIDTFQKWIKTFPFGLSCFEGLKELLDQKIPAFKDAGIHNPYTDFTKHKGISEKELLIYLDDLTKRLIQEVEPNDFDLSDMQKHRIELLNQQLRIKVDKLTNQYSEHESKYLTTIKKWLKIQNEYFKELVGITETMTQKAIPKPTEKNKPIPIRVFAYYEFYLAENTGKKQETVRNGNEVHGINGDSLYNELVKISGNREYRLTRAYANDLEKAIEMLKKNGVDQTKIDKAELDLRTARQAEKRK